MFSEQVCLRINAELSPWLETARGRHGLHAEAVTDIKAQQLRPPVSEVPCDWKYGKPLLIAVTSWGVFEFQIPGPSMMDIFKVESNGVRMECGKMT